jgi:hypothetical protein
VATLARGTWTLRTAKAIGVYAELKGSPKHSQQLHQHESELLEEEDHEESQEETTSCDRRISQQQQRFTVFVNQVLANRKWEIPERERPPVMPMQLLQNKGQAG